MKCPHCHAVVDKKTYHGMSERYFWGNPDRVCIHCKKGYYDSRYVEIATKPLSWFEKRKPYDSLGSILVIIRYVLIVIALLFNEMISTCVFLYACDWVALIIYSYTHTEFVVDDKFRQEYQESSVRLEMRKYAERVRKEELKKYRDEHERYAGLDYREIIAKAKAENRRK